MFGGRSKSPGIHVELNLDLHLSGADVHRNTGQEYHCCAVCRTVETTPARLTEYKCAGGHRVDSTLDFFFTNPCLTSQASSVYAAQ